MTDRSDTASAPIVSVEPVTRSSWRDVARLRVRAEQRRFVAEPAYYLALCCYGEVGWSPLAIRAEGEVAGFLMWAVDPEDGACWLGGILVDADWQGRGVGEAAVRAALALLEREHGRSHFALSYEPENERARRLYARLGFVETGEVEGDEVVARLRSATP